MHSISGEKLLVAILINNIMLKINTHGIKLPSIKKFKETGTCFPFQIPNFSSYCHHLSISLLHSKHATEKSHRKSKAIGGGGATLVTDDHASRSEIKLSWQQLRALEAMRRTVGSGNAAGRDSSAVWCVSQLISSSSANKKGDSVCERPVDTRPITTLCSK